MLGRLAYLVLRPFGLELRRSCRSDPFWVQAQLVKKPAPVGFDVGAAPARASVGSTKREGV